MTKSDFIVVSVLAAPVGAVLGTIAGLFIGGPVLGLFGYVFTGSMFWQPDWLDRATGGVGMVIGLLTAIGIVFVATED